MPFDYSHIENYANYANHNENKDGSLMPVRWTDGGMG